MEKKLRVFSKVKSSSRCGTKILKTILILKFKGKAKIELCLLSHRNLKISNRTSGIYIKTIR